MEVFPYYLSYGMSYEEFWHGDPWLVVAYRTKHRIESKMLNEQAWLYGYYIHNAVAVAIHNKFRQKGENAQSYMEKPIRMEPATKLEAEAERKAYIERIAAQLGAMKASSDARRENAEN